MIDIKERIRLGLLFNQQNELVKITLDRFWGKYHLGVECKADDIDKFEKLDNEIMDQYFVEKK